MLIILGGLPGVGKTTISRKLAEYICAVHLRIDTIETAIVDSTLNIKDAQNAGYLAAYGIAQDNLIVGRTVVADSVNATEVTRSAWREVAESAGVRFIEVEVICSDKKEHQKRFESRPADERLYTRTWQEVLDREYELWKPEGIMIDTALSTPDQCVEQIREFMQ